MPMNWGIEPQFLGSTRDQRGMIPSSTALSRWPVTAVNSPGSTSLARLRPESTRKYSPSRSDGSAVKPPNWAILLMVVALAAH